MSWIWTYFVHFSWNLDSTIKTGQRCPSCATFVDDEEHNAQELTDATVALLLATIVGDGRRKVVHADSPVDFVRMAGQLRREVRARCWALMSAKSSNCESKINKAKESSIAIVEMAECQD